jgi:hypothetical protein
MNKNEAILAVCEAGMVRSVAFATELKWHRGYKNVLNCGTETTAPETFAMLCRWADCIYVTADRTIWRQIPATFKAKAVFVDVGKDIWQDPSASSLKLLMRQECNKLGL